MAKRLKWFASSDRRFEIATDLSKRLLKEGADDAGAHVLLLKITAEATCNPAIANIVREANRLLGANAVAIMRRSNAELREEDAAARIEFTTVISKDVSLGN